jgi:hypothetical protein
MDERRKYQVTVFNDCHTSHNTRINDLSLMEADGIGKMLRKQKKLFTIKPERKFQTENKRIS